MIFSSTALENPQRLESLSRRALPFRSDVWLLVFIATQPLESSFSLGNATVLTLSKLAGAVSIVTFGLDLLSTGRKLRLDKTHAILMILLVIELLSAVHARSESAGFATTVRYGGFAALYVIITQFVDDDSLLAHIAWILSAACSLAALLAIRNFASGSTLQAEPSYGDPNDLAYMLATTLPFSLWLLGNRGWRRLAAAAMTGLTLIALALTFSRGALLALFAGSLWVVLRERSYRKMVLVAILIGAVPLFWFIHLHEQQLATGLSAKGVVAASNVEERLEFYRVAVSLVNEHGLLGVGPGNFPLYLSSALENTGVATSYVVHDAYLEIAAELGLPALILFLSYLAIVFWRAHSTFAIQGFAPAVRVALVIAIVGALPLSEEYYAPLWLLGGLATVLWGSSQSGVDTE